MRTGPRFGTYVDKARLASGTEVKVTNRTPFVDRRAAYIEGRTSIRSWYVQKARYNRSRARLWRLFLIPAEVVAVVRAFGRVFGQWHIDVAGLYRFLHREQVACLIVIRTDKPIPAVRFGR